MLDCQSNAPKRRKKSNTSTWKKVELKIAALLGGERVPVTGRARGSAPDIKQPVLALEVKHGKQIPKLVLEAMDQAEKSVRGDQVPMAVMHPLRAEYSDSICIVRLKDLQRLCDLYGRPDLPADS